LDNALGLTDPILEAALAESAAAGLPEIHVPASFGKLLQMLVRLLGSRRVLEVGTLGGYSTIWLARGLPAGGTLVTLEISEHHAAVARKNLARAALNCELDVRVGPALDSLDALLDAGSAPFDFVFIDADKPNNPHYFERALAMCRSGGVIVVDNVVRDGEIADPSSTSPAVRGVWDLHARIAANPRVTATAIQTVGSKGYDGFTLVHVI
jgi:predicted O-methyltransferase YrrM